MSIIIEIGFEAKESIDKGNDGWLGITFYVLGVREKKGTKERAR